MAKLKMAKLSLQTATLDLAPTYGMDEAERSRHRRSVNPWRDWYNTPEWRRLRWMVLVEAEFTCAMCGRIEGETSRLVADHIVAHRGNRALFFDRANLQCLCKACHDGAKQRQERAEMAGGGSISGARSTS